MKPSSVQLPSYGQILPSCLWQLGCISDRICVIFFITFDNFSSFSFIVFVLCVSCVGVLLCFYFGPSVLCSSAPAPHSPVPVCGAGEVFVIWFSISSTCSLCLGSCSSGAVGTFPRLVWELQLQCETLTRSVLPHQLLVFY